MGKAKKLRKLKKEEKRLDKAATHLLNFDRGLFQIGHGEIERNVVMGYIREAKPYSELFKYRYGVYVEPHSNNYIVVEENHDAIRYPADDVLLSVAYDLIRSNGEALYNFLIYALKSYRDLFIYLRKTVDSYNDYDVYDSYYIIRVIGD